MKNDYTEIKKIKMSDYRNKNTNFFAEETHFSESIGMHWHDYYEIEFILEGTGHQILNGTRYEIVPGSFHLLTPSDFHDIIPDKELHMIKICFEDSTLNPLISAMLNSLPQNIDITFENNERKVLENTFSALLQAQAEMKNPEFFSAILKNTIENTLIFVFDYFERINHKQSTHALSNDTINIILAYIERNFKKQITLNEVAEHVHFSPSYLSRYFHNSTGLTFKEYIKKKRMSYAAKLIAYTNHSITEICYESGFASLSNFINEFKKIYSLSPSEYRRNKKS